MSNTDCQEHISQFLSLLQMISACPFLKVDSTTPSMDDYLATPCLGGSMVLSGESGKQN